jgi:hypothetical protein
LGIVDNVYLIVSSTWEDTLPRIISALKVEKDSKLVEAYIKAKDRKMRLKKKP